MAEQDADKSHEPTQKRLDDARAKGQIARSQDVLTAAAYSGFLIAVVVFGEDAIRSAGGAGMSLLDRPETGDAPGAILAMLAPVVPLLLFPALPVIALLVIQRAVTVTPANLAPKLSRINPLAAAAQRFGPDGLMDFFKGSAKMVLVGLILALFLQAQAPEILLASWLDPGPGAARMAGLLVQFLTLLVALSLVIGGVDYLWQVRRHRIRNRMSRQEVLDEYREAEGDPQTRATRRQRGQDIAMNRMLADVPKADVVIVNPTHYAVALKWHRERRQAPICVAKGKDAVAARIRAVAAESGVPIQSDPPTARALFATVDIGQQIRPEHFRAVAAAIRFAEAMRKRARARG